ncbi:hypothetical protein [Methanobrevibacter smithii]|uniref:hypothetical protein n=1 Tax=Methanobrevibacter smithii TaxID=2173 RepID=UPI0037DD92FA
MTSEIMILTPNAIALATDSAITIDNRKIYNGVNKLFMLSNDPPMGIMTYNGARFFNIPFETIIKEFRSEINDKNITKTIDFKEEFEKYLQKIPSKSPYKESFEDKLMKFIDIVSNEYDTFGKNDFFNRLMNVMLPLDSIKIVHDNIQSEHIEKAKVEFKNLCSQFKYADKEEDFIQRIFNLFIFEMFVKSFTGVVLSGFDEDRLFPIAYSFKIFYLYDGKFIWDDLKDYDILKNNIDVIVEVFAQDDVIKTFLTGIDDETRFHIVNFFNEINNNYTNELVNLINTNDNIDENSKNEIFNEINTFNAKNKVLPIKFNNFIDEVKGKNLIPIFKSIGALPFDELSNLCESLIKVTSLKRKVQPDLETVGGDVDVAIITKGDGFIWTKRKHYFNADLNPQFFDRKNL